MKRKAEYQLDRQTMNIYENLISTKFRDVQGLPIQTFSTCWFFSILSFIISSPEIQHHTKQLIINEIQRDAKKFLKFPTTCSKEPSRNALLKFIFHILYTKSILLKSVKNYEMSLSQNYSIRSDVHLSGMKESQLIQRLTLMLNRLGLSMETLNATKFGYGAWRRFPPGYIKKAEYLVVDFGDDGSHGVCVFNKFQKRIKTRDGRYIARPVLKYVMDSNIGIPLLIKGSIEKTLSPYYKGYTITGYEVLATLMIKQST